MSNDMTQCSCCSVKARSNLWRCSGTLLCNGGVAVAWSQHAAALPAKPICLPVLQRLAGIDTENLTMLATPYTEDLIGPGNTQEGGNSSFKVRLGHEEAAVQQALFGMCKAEEAAGMIACMITSRLGHPPGLGQLRGAGSACFCSTRPCVAPPPLQAWIIAVIVGVILIVVPVPAYLLVRWRKRKNKEAAAIQVRCRPVGICCLLVCCCPWPQS